MNRRTWGLLAVVLLGAQGSCRAAEPKVEVAKEVADAGIKFRKEWRRGDNRLIVPHLVNSLTTEKDDLEQGAMRFAVYDKGGEKIDSGFVYCLARPKGEAGR